MQAALILYGSRARGEAGDQSDVDLLLAEMGSGLRRPHLSHGVSVHWYAQDWLREQAAMGNLFAYHIAFEGIPLIDPANFLSSLRDSFVKKANYRLEATEAALVLSLTMLQDWHAGPRLRRRFFWALRTLLISESAESGTPVFSAQELESTIGISGISRLIQARADAPFEECLRVGSAVLSKCDFDSFRSFSERELRDFMLGQGGMAAESVRLIEEPEMLEASANLPYL